MARKSKRTKFVVEGSGSFPFDMLRYDACWPATEYSDPYKLSGDHDTERRRVTLLSDWQGAPTEGRWRSFGWQVVSTEAE